jgi:hypothetical protein
VRDASDTGEYPPRYFSATDELVVTLRSARFQIDPKTDIHTYEVGDGGDKFTENVFVATKPS